MTISNKGAFLFGGTCIP